MWWKKNQPDLRQIVANEMAKALKNNATSDSIRSRIAQLLSGSNFTGDTLHQIDVDYGYPEALTFQMFWNMYRRFGIAKNVVELPTDVGWMTNPIVESSEAFENAVEKLDASLNLWQRLKGLDTRQRVGRYAGLFMRVRDNKNPKEPLEKVSGEGALMEVIPLYEGQLSVESTDDDPMSENYGKPKMYMFNGSGVGSRSTEKNNNFSIHPSRLVISAEGADNGSIYGISSLEGCYNSLMDLRKIIGAGGEGFYKNASQSIIFKLMDAASAATNKELLSDFNDEYDDFSKNRMRRSMWTPGLDPVPLESSLVSPKEFFNIALNDVAASTKIPATILIGQQTGRLASSEDSRHFLSGMNSRRENVQTEQVSSVLDWCIKWGVLPSAEYTIKWDDLLALSREEKLKNAKEMAAINKEQFVTGGTVPFSGEEIREIAGFEPEDSEIPDDAETDETTED